MASAANQCATSNLPVTASAANQYATSNLPVTAFAAKQYATSNLPVTASAANQCATSNLPATSSDTNHESSKDEELAGRELTIKLKMQKSLPYCILQDILQRILLLDSQIIINGFGVDDWPAVYAPDEIICCLCGSSLSGKRPHPGQKIGDGGFLITNSVLFEKVTILVKQCLKCKAMVQVFPYDFGKICSLAS